MWKELNPLLDPYTPRKSPGSDIRPASGRSAAVAVGLGKTEECEIEADSKEGQATTQN